MVTVEGVTPDGPFIERRRSRSPLKTGALQDAIFNSEHFSSIATDEAGVIQIFNVGAERMLGYAAADVLNLITPADISDSQELIARAAALSLELATPITPGFEALVFKASRGIEDIYELTYIRKDGSRFPAIVSVTALRDAQERILGYLLIGTDNTARKHVEENQARLDQHLRDERERFERALQGKNVELEHASRMKSEFLATMSHELRTPLNAIIGFSEALNDGLAGPLSDTQREYIGDIFGSGQHLLSLINDILDLSKVEAGMMTLELEPAELPSVLASCLAIVREKAAAHDIGLVLDIAADLGTTLLDVRKTKQIVYNLLSNAVKFSAPGTGVTLRAKRVPRSAVGTLPGEWPVHGFPLADSPHGEFLEICVSDSGIGISPTDMAILFQAFSQIDSRLSRQFEGTGLGLAMVKRMAELHGGAVAVASAEGAGAAFAAWLPLRSTFDLPPRVAMIIQEDDNAADLIRPLLEAEGFAVVRVASAEAALLIAPRQALGLIALDAHLPGMDGWEFLLRIRDDEALGRVPVVVSGLVDNNMALAVGAAAVLCKPVRRAELQASLAAMGLKPDQAVFRVLIVDDDPKAVELLAAFLPFPTYSVERAYGGEEAIERARHLLPDLILLDLIMPDVSGFDVAAALQRDPATAGIPILVVTAKSMTPRDRAALGPGAGVVNIVDKEEFSPLRFVEEVRRALRRH